ncbi:MAG: ATP-dependent DNA helicase [Maricaulis sp.]|jgi:ATP-dependent RNA helicase SUPV3L1/SUV3|nr:ATP-dependent DNA helicase [Maricaulis sp.]HAQ36740.1 ATP-dependent DNA helicase [Alphaproteobacteria bacterium]
MSAYSELTAVLGPTNTGKTHLAVERMLARSSGMIGLPLRLLAREIYDRVVKVKGRNAAALITGEEKIAPPSARYFICTVESMPLDMRVAFVAVDEVQLAADPDRGHVFTDRMLNLRGTEETMLLGASTVEGLIRRLVPDADILQRERFSTLRYAGPTKITKLPRRSAIVAFSAESVYAIAELLRRQRGGAAVVLGALSPRTRNAQVALYQSGEVDYLVATDAIGMGLNMDVDHVAFAEINKFDGHRRRALTPAELGQIAGRAGRFRDDGTFGETADVRPLEGEVVEALENHEFARLDKLQWRNNDLDLRSLDTLYKSLRRRSPDPALERVRGAEDERVLEVLASDEAVRRYAATPHGVSMVWDACRIPDFRKITIDAHARLVRQILDHLMSPNGRIPSDYMAGHLDRLDRIDGDVALLSQRLAHVRTWAYVSHRGDWTEDAHLWRDRAREVEDRLSDALHECLTQRFVDRRTSALIRGLREDRELLAGVTSDGRVSVEGHDVGHLEGLRFVPDISGAALEARALRQAAERALRPEVNRRLGRLTKAETETLTIAADGRIQQDEQDVAVLAAGDSLMKPGVTLTGGELGAQEARERAIKRIDAFVQGEITTRLAPLLALRAAAADGKLTGMARGIAHRLEEAGGCIARRDVLTEIRALSPVERRQLRSLGVRLGEHVIFLPALTKPAAAGLASLLRATMRGDGQPPFRPAPGLVTVPAEEGREAGDYAATGFHRCGPLAVRVDMLERLADLIRDGRTLDDGPGFAMTADMTSILGCSVADLRGVLNALGYRRIQTGPDPEKAEGERWDVRKRKHRAPAPEPVKVDPDSPFAALAALATPAARPAKTKPRRARRKPRTPNRAESPPKTKPGDTSAT